MTYFDHKNFLRSQLFTYSTGILFLSIMVGERFQAILSIAMGINLLSILAFTSLKDLWKNFIGNKALLILSFSFLFLFISFLNSTNYSYLMERLQIKLPILLYCFTLASMPVLTIKQLRIVFYFFTSGLLLTSFGILINYALHFDEINQMYLESKIMPGPINHIRFSLLVVFATYFIYYFIKNNLFSSQVQKRVLYAIGLFFVFFLHIYSVRSGLVTLYITFFICALNHIHQTKNIKEILTACIALVIIGGLSFVLSPTMRNKLINTQADVDVYHSQKDPNYNSLSTRVVSYKTALMIVKENWILGCGQGDLKDKNDSLFETHFPSISTPIIPHNQFIYYLAATGILGLIVFTISFTSLLWSKQFFRTEFIQIAYAILLVAFQFEAMLETQIGVATTVVILFTSYYYSKSRQTIIGP